MYLRIYRAAFGLLALAAVAREFCQALLSHKFIALVDFFCFFTHYSNSLAAALFLYGAIRPGETRMRLDVLRGAAVVYMLITGVVFWVLLAQVIGAAAFTFASLVTHAVMPAAVLADWLWSPPRRPLKLKCALGWTIFPLSFAVVMVVGGGIFHGYIYPFFDPAKSGGYAGVVGNCVGILAGGLVAGVAVIKIGNARIKATPQN
jgi:hypothetical protein